MALVGFHIVHRTFSAPQWVWATFEHQANAPDYANVVNGNLPRSKYSYFDPGCISNACTYNALPQFPWTPASPGRA